MSSHASKIKRQCFSSGVLPSSSDGWVHWSIGFITFKVRDADNSTEEFHVLTSTMAIKIGCCIGW